MSTAKQILAELRAAIEAKHAASLEAIDLIAAAVDLVGPERGMLIVEAFRTDTSSPEKHSNLRKPRGRRATPHRGSRAKVILACTGQSRSLEELIAETGLSKATIYGVLHAIPLRDNFRSYWDQGKVWYSWVGEPQPEAEPGMPWCEPCQSYHSPEAPGCFAKERPANAVDCPICDGEGYVEASGEHGDTCQRCHGRKWVFPPVGAAAETGL